MMRRVLITILVAPLFNSSLVMASGWVKAQDDYYFKLNQAQSDTKQPKDPGILYSERENTLSLYGEYGLGILPWKSHASIYASRKSITRKETAASADKYEAASLTDTHLLLKNEVYDLSSTGEFPYNLKLSTTVGFHLPTTPDKFSLGNSDQRSSDVPSQKSYLLATIDKGSSAVVLGIGASISYRFAWVNWGFDRIMDTSSDWLDQKHSFSAGVGLPHNSWLQITHMRFQSEIKKQLTTDQTMETESSLTSLGVGVTVWQGLAVELATTETSEDKWSDRRTVSIGCSYRRL